MSFDQEDTRPRARRPSGIGAEPAKAEALTESDRRLIDHVLQGQQALQASILDLHCVVASMRGDNEQAVGGIRVQLNNALADIRSDMLIATGEMSTASATMATANRDYEARIKLLETADVAKSARISTLELARNVAAATLAAVLAMMATVWTVWGDKIKQGLGG